MSYSRGERRGIIALLGLILVFICVPYYLEWLHKEEVVEDIGGFEAGIREFEAGLKTKAAKPDYYSAELAGEPEQFIFNPNEISEDSLLLLGISRKVARNLIKYRNAGGRFYNKEGLLKIYDFEQADYDRLESYIQIPEKRRHAKVAYTANGSYAESKEEFTIKKIEPVELNTADSTQLVQLRGIGPAFAGRIIKYRDLLGGYFKKEQLLEVYGLDTGLYKIVAPYVLVNDSGVRRLNVNTAPGREIGRHPYIGYKLGNQMENYREQHGEYKVLEDLKKLYLMNDSIYNKIIPYLTIHD